MLTITSDNFEQEVLKSDKKVLVDFWASWCGPCRMLSPIIDEVAKSTDKVKVGKVNVDEESDLATSMGYKTVYLGKRILRAETASIALLGIIMHSLGELE